ncbi:MAG TPA: hypothetical protein VKC15_15010 [Gemmatimonadales bacterium]|nr:hypothetical protein [Gemmatimonadales bacterium]
MLPRPSAAQRVVDFQPVRAAYAASAPDRLGFTGSIPVRMPWRASEVVLAGGFTAALLLDAAQTRRLARGGWRDFHETNPLLGPRPSVGRVNTYTAVVGLSVLGAAALAPKRARPWVLGIAFAVEACTLAAMSQRGVAISF